MSHPFHIVDVFAQQRYTGNQLAVVRGAGDLSDREMQGIAAEMNYSETTFIESEERSPGGLSGSGLHARNRTPLRGAPDARYRCRAPRDRRR